MSTTYTGTLVAITCGKCGTTFGVEHVFHEERKLTRTTFYCPNGHALSYTTSSLTELREKMEAKLAHAEETAQWHARRAASAEGQARRADYQARAAKGQLTKAKKRIAAGVCPCCNRTFQNLARHMVSQHPDFAPTDSESES